MSIIAKHMDRINLDPITTVNPFQEVLDFIATLPLPEGPRPTWEGDRYEPEATEALWWAGFTLGLQGLAPNQARPSAGLSDQERYYFGVGRQSGWIESEEGQDWIADMEAARDQPMDREYHPCEQIEARGAIEARKG